MFRSGLGLNFPTSDDRVTELSDDGSDYSTPGSFPEGRSTQGSSPDIKKPLTMLPSTPLPLTVGIELEFVFRLTTISGKRFSKKLEWLHTPSSQADILEQHQSRAMIGEMSPRRPAEPASPESDDEAPELFVDAVQIPELPDDLDWNHDCPQCDGSSQSKAAHQFYELGSTHVGTLISATKVLMAHKLKAVPNPYAKSKAINFNDWLLTTDSSILYDKEGLMFDQVLTCTRTEEYDVLHLGTELVSRILPAPALDQTATDPTLIEVKRYVQPLKGSDNDRLQEGYYSFVNGNCGFHVHVGLDRSGGFQSFPLKVLKHIAYMSVQYEGLISRLLPEERRGLANTATDSMAESNLMGLKNSGHVCDRIPLPLMQVIEEKLFGEDVTLESLARLMGAEPRGTLSKKMVSTRFKFVNWEHQLTFHKRQASSLPVRRSPTLEFRQHEGTLDPIAISEWIIFVTAFVRAAEKTAAKQSPQLPQGTPRTPRSAFTPTYHGLVSQRSPRTLPQVQTSKYVIRCQNLEEQLSELFDLLHLPQSSETYWLSRFQANHPEEFGPTGEKPVRCAACHAEDEREKAGRKARLDGMGAQFGITPQSRLQETLDAVKDAKGADNAQTRRIREKHARRIEEQLGVKDFGWDEVESLEEDMYVLCLE